MWVEMYCVPTGWEPKIALVCIIDNNHKCNFWFPTLYITFFFFKFLPLLQSFYQLNNSTVTP